jgi:hypothetical protein
MKSYSVVEKEITEFMATESREIEDGIDDAVERIQNTMQNNSIVSQLPQELRRIMNMWVRTNWYHTDRVAKFEHCLHTIVARELRDRVFNRLVKEVRDNDDQMVDYEDLRDWVKRVSHTLALGCSRYWQTMETDLLAEAKHWVSVHGEHVTMGDDGHFRWYDIIKQVGWRAEPIEKQVAIRSLKRLPCDFQHQADWTCAICLDVDASVPRCVITECAHIYHELCLKNHYRAFLKQKKNENKTCFSCPLCRAIIN